MNYFEYLDVWNDVHSHMIRNDVEVGTICMGAEWYYFPSHFFLPKDVKVQFVKDSFFGEMPQHFSKENGTFAEPLRPFNDQNKDILGRSKRIRTHSGQASAVDRAKHVCHR